MDIALWKLAQYWKVRASFYEAVYRIGGGTSDPFELCGSGKVEVKERPISLSEHGRLSDLFERERSGLL